jgi:hypothetical protein
MTWTAITHKESNFKQLYRHYEMDYLRYIKECLDKQIAPKSFKVWYSEII